MSKIKKNHKRNHKKIIKLKETKKMRKFSNEGFVKTEFGVSQESFLYFFNEAKKYIKEVNNPTAFAAKLHLGLTIIEANKDKMPFYEGLLGHRIVLPEDIVAYALTIELLVIQERLNELEVKKGA